MRQTWPWAAPAGSCGLGHGSPAAPREAREGGLPRPAPSVRFPHLVEELDHLVVDDEDDGHVEADAAQARHRALVKPARDRGEPWGWGPSQPLPCPSSPLAPLCASLCSPSPQDLR